MAAAAAEAEEAAVAGFRALLAEGVGPSAAAVAAVFAEEAEADFAVACEGDEELYITLFVYEARAP